MESATALLKDDGLDLEDGVELEEERSGPPTTREEPAAFPVRKLETIAIFVIFAIAYTWIGFRVLADQHVVSFEALDRLTRAFMVWHNDPPKLAAIGFSLPPIGTFLLIPFAAVREAVTSGFALPLSSALFAAGALTFLNRMFATADMGRIARLLIIVLVGVNPMFAFYAMNGTGDAASLFFVSFALFCLVAWGRHGSPRYLIGAGLAMSGAALTSYEFIAWAFFIAWLIGAAIGTRKHVEDEVEGSIIAYLAPVGYALGIWIFFNAIVLGNPFEWISLASDSTPVNAVSSAAPGFDIIEAIGNSLRIQMIFPAALVAVPLLLLGFGGGRDTISIGLAGLILLSIAYSLLGALIEGSIDVIELRDALPGMFAGLAGFAWLFFRSTDMRAAIWGLLIALSVVALPLAWSQMESYPHQALEQAFTRAISSGDDQEGTSSRGGYIVGVAPEAEMAQFINDQAIPDNNVLTDNSRTYGVISLTGRPELFFDRVDKGDQVWRDALENPVDKVEFMLVERDDADLILSRYPGAIEGEVPSLEPVVSNERYALLRVLDVIGSPEEGADGSPSATSGQQTPTGSAPPITSGPPPGSER